MTPSEDNINMSPGNFDTNREAADRLREEIEGMEDKMLFTDEHAGIAIWQEDYESHGQMVFLAIDNMTITLSEQDFYALTKGTQKAAKRLLNIDD